MSSTLMKSLHLMHLIDVCSCVLCTNMPFEVRSGLIRNSFHNLIKYDQSMYEDAENVRRIYAGLLGRLNLVKHIVDRFTMLV